MRADPAQYDLVAPRAFGEVLALLARNPGRWTPIAGGTDLMVLYAAGKLPHQKLVSLGGCPELRAIDVSTAEIRIGAAATYTNLRQHPVISDEFPLLARAASWTGGIANQNRGTLGGNIANASPAGDSLPVLLAYDADLILVSLNGERRIPYSGFHTGYKKSVLAPDELIRAIALRRNTRSYATYVKKVGARNAQAISKVYLAGVGRAANGKIEDIRLAAGSVGPTPIRLTQTENAITGQTLGSTLVERASRILTEEITPIDDIRSTRRYRTAVLRNLLAEFLQSLAAKQATP